MFTPLLILALQFKESPKHPPLNTLLHRKTLTLSTLNHGLRLIKGLDKQFSQITPSAPFMRPFLVDKHNQCTRIDDLNELGSNVKISTKDQALEYVRLLTNDDSWYLWSSGEAREVNMISKSKTAHIPGFKDGFMGQVSDQKYEKSIRQFPQVVQGKDGYLITRLVIERKAPQVIAYVIQENVGPTGTYRLLDESLDKVPPDLASVSWAIPGWK